MDDANTLTDPNDELLHQLLVAVERLVEHGMERDEALTRAAERMTKVLEETAPTSANAYETTGLEHVAQLREYQEGFEERLRVHWGEALDLCQVVVEIIHQASQQFSDRNSHVAGDQATLLGVLHRLNGQALRVAREVHALASAGYPLGALSLSRTSHEISVRAIVLSEFGSTPGHTDLAERFLRHADVVNYKDAVIYQRDVEKLGYEPFDDKTLDALRLRSDHAKSRYDKYFPGPYGWASGLPGLPSPSPTFEHLEELAGLAHHRGLYKWSSHLVHADAKALRLTMVERGGRSAILTAATNQALADPAQHALIGLYRTFVSLVTSVPISFYDLQICHVLGILVDKTDHLLVDAEHSVDEAEGRLQAELAKRGMRFDPIDGEVPLQTDDLT
jgi:hypothetical protein